MRPSSKTNGAVPDREPAIHRGHQPPMQKGRPTVATNEEILAGMAEILNEVADVAEADVTVDKSFTDDLDVDSLSMVEVAMAAEEKFGVKIPDEELPKLKTVGDAVSYISSNPS